MMYAALDQGLVKVIVPSELTFNALTLTLYTRLTARPVNVIDVSEVLKYFLFVLSAQEITA